MILHSRFWVCVAFATFSYARITRSKPSTPLLRTATDPRRSIPYNPYLRQSNDDDVFVLSKRDLDSDTLSSPVPVSDKGYTANFHPNDGRFTLRSSSLSVNSTIGHEIYALPIFTNDLSTLLSDTEAYLRSLNNDATTKFFQFNTTKWSFSTIAPQTSLHHTIIHAAIVRFIKLASSKPSSDLTTTRVGLLLNGTTPIADIIILPRPATVNTTYTPFAHFSSSANDNLSSSQPTEVFKVSPYGSTCALEIINATTALAPFFNSGPVTTSTSNSTSTLTPRDIGSEVLARVGQTIFALSLRVLRDAMEDNFNAFHPVAVERWMVDAVIFLAISNIYLELVEGIILGLSETLPARYKGFGSIKDRKWLVGNGVIDTGIYSLGKMLGRLIAHISCRDAQGRVIPLEWVTWLKIVERMILPLRQQQQQQQREDGDGEGGDQVGLLGMTGVGWAMEGEIYGPEDGDWGEDNEDDHSGSGGGSGGQGGGEKRQVVIGRWQLWIGSTTE